MKLEYGGVALFVLIYIYVWFKNYVVTTALLDTIDVTPVTTILFKLSICGWEVVGYGAVIFLVFVVLITTCFRALSMGSIGRALDPFSLRIAFGWLKDRRLIGTLISATILSTFLILIVVAAYLVAITPVIKPQKKTTPTSFETFLAYPWRYVVYQSRRVFAPYVDPNVARVSLVRAALMINLLTVIMTVLMVFADVGTHYVLPATAVGGLQSAPSYTMNDYAKMFS